MQSPALPAVQCNVNAPAEHWPSQAHASAPFDMATPPVDVWPYLTDVLRRIVAIAPGDTAALEKTAVSESLGGQVSQNGEQPVGLSKAERILTSLAHTLNVD